MEQSYNSTNIKNEELCKKWIHILFNEKYGATYMACWPNSQRRQLKHYWTISVLRKDKWQLVLMFSQNNLVHQWSMCVSNNNKWCKIYISIHIKLLNDVHCDLDFNDVVFNNTFGEIGQVRLAPNHFAPYHFFHKYDLEPECGHALFGWIDLDQIVLSRDVWDNDHVPGI